MEQESTCGEFWLPPEFLTEEDILMDFSTVKSNSGTPNVSFNKGTSGLYGFGSNGPVSGLGSPVESVMGSTEAESDEDDYLNGLSMKFANTNIHENNYSKSTRAIVGSPQSTLCGCKLGSSRGSPNCPSPPSAASEANRNQSSWDLLYAAAGELARIRMVEEAASRYYNPTKNFLAPQPPREIGTHDRHYQQLQVAQFQKLKQQQLAKQQYMQMLLQQSRTRNDTGNGRPVALQQPPQRHQGSGMRAVFLGNPSIKRESTGTGVFLPRQTGGPTEPVKKRGCPTVLLPDRVVQALNLNLETMEAPESNYQSRCNGRSLVSDYDAEIMYRQSVMLAQQSRDNHRRQPSPAAMPELRLPQEWTY